MTVGFSPVSGRDRIQALDVVRGFALLGILLMNVEFFNRPLAALGDGLPTGLSGADWWSAVLIHLFVRDKFFSLFSILFGMGFALMLARAQAAGRPFLGVYLRRTLALALFGIAHGCLLWAGDILLSYACAALLLLVVLFKRGWMTWLAFAVVIAVGFTVSLGDDAAFTAMILVIDGVVLSLLRRGSSGRPALAGASLRRAGFVLYLLPALLMVVAGSLVWQSEARMSSPRAEVSAEMARAHAERERVLATYRAEQEQRIEQETQHMTRGSYWAATAFRAPAFVGDFLKSLFFLSVAMGLFMIGAWLLQSGAVDKPAGHLPLFRRFIWLALPLGLACALASFAIATDASTGQGRLLLASGLLFASGLPMALGYLGLLMLALQRVRWQRLLGWMAPAGRMALTNYIGQSLLGTLFFYGYGLGYWGMPRAQQVVFVLVLFTLQVLVSRWWLTRFRFGPLEWLWRWMTYGTRPAMRVEVQAAIAGP